ncbi:Uncharacterised protein [Mycobacteroides abscessus subsp. abscessus]|nr:Uncharacterised protein [Mycobacteroides abscessus subsp. abscessus]
MTKSLNQYPVSGSSAHMCRSVQMKTGSTI